MDSTASVELVQCWVYISPLQLVLFFLHSRKYKIVRFYNLERIPLEDEGRFVLYFLELELGCDALDYTERVVEYVLLQNHDQNGVLTTDAQLCYPRGLDWNKDAVVHLILAVHHEGPRFRRFIEKLEKIFKENLEVYFHLVVVNSGNAGLDIREILGATSLLKYKVEELEGDFSWTRAINYGIRQIQDPGHIILTVDVHMDLPASIFEDCRKVSFQYLLPLFLIHDVRL